MRKNRASRSATRKEHGARAHRLSSAPEARVVQDEVDEAPSAGLTQVLAFAARVDILRMGLAPVHPNVSFVEPDHPASQAAKRQASEALGENPANLHFLALDLETGPH